MRGDNIVVCIGSLIIAGLLMLAGAYLNRSPASNYWKTEIVRRGYGTWETTPTGEVWFKWKEPQAREEKEEVK